LPSAKQQPQQQERRRLRGATSRPDSRTAGAGDGPTAGVAVRGWRADGQPVQAGFGIKADAVSHNTLLRALAKVRDTLTIL
jgi:hypothetical protein